VAVVSVVVAAVVAAATAVDSAAVASNVGKPGVRPGTKNAAEKRKKEVLRQKRQKEKVERRQQRQSDRQDRGPLGPDEDPDLAGIVPGPQPIEGVPGGSSPEPVPSVDSAITSTESTGPT
jgi:hypothetical protein